jgi:hypothetical protein
MLLPRLQPQGRAQIGFGLAGRAGGPLLLDRSRTPDYRDRRAQPGSDGPFELPSSPEQGVFDMRRIVSVAAVVVGAGVLLVAALAFGAKRQYEGNGLDPVCDLIPDPACTVNFDAKVKRGKVKSVGNFVFEQIPISCDQGNFAVSNDQVPINGMKVNKKRKFKGVWNGPDQQRIKVSGRFSKNWKSAKGTLSDRGDFPPTATNCDTGRDKWKAAR